MGSDKNISSAANIPEIKTPQLSEEYRKLHVRPWARFFAKIVDIFFFSIVIGILAGFIYPPLFTTYNDTINSLFIIFLWFLVEPIVLSIFGTTLGKYLCNIQLRDLNGNKLNFKSAFSRSFWVWLVGFGCGLPIISLFTFSFAYNDLKKTGTTRWDKNKFIITHTDIGYIKIIISILIIAMTFGLSTWTVVMRNLPFDSAHEVVMQNKELPKMIDHDTELSKITLLNDTVTYQYRLVNTSESQIDKTLFYNGMNNQIITSLCNQPSDDVFFSHGLNIIFNYNDKDGAPVINILVKPSDCH